MRLLEITVTSLGSFTIGLLPAVLLMGLNLFMIYAYKTNTYLRAPVSYQVLCTVG
jgi:hypothetical protein